MSALESNKFRTLLEFRQRHGINAAVQLIADRIGNRLFGIEVVNLVCLETVDVADFGTPDPEFEFRFLQPSEVEEYMIDPSNQLSSQFAERASAGLDLCFAALSGGQLAAYGWYAKQSIEAEHNFGVAMSYQADSAYMYKGFTHPDFRGRRLHGRLMGLALKGLRNEGICRLVSTVNWTNHASMRSCQRLGYRLIGHIVVAGSFERRVIYATKHAAAIGVRLGTDAAIRE